MKYEIKLTPLAKAFAESRTSVAALEERVRGEIAEIMNNANDEEESPEDRIHPLDIFFHTFEMGDQEFICSPRDGVMLVDTCSREPMGKLDAGPFEGKEVLFPTGDTED